MKITIILLISLLTGNVLFAQTNKFITAGTIEYEKSVNTFAINRLLVAEYPAQTQAVYTQRIDQYQRQMPQFAILNSKLVFNNNKTLFTPIEANNGHPVNYFFATPIATQINTVYTDLTTNTRSVQKDVLGNQFLLSDSLSKIKWKITDETQEIAGYTCRRANGIIQDSIYVVAFYTDKIWVSGGPESFSGLPGMILEVALPHEHVTWLAKKVTIEAPATPIAPPKKGKPVNNKQLFDILNGAIRNPNFQSRYGMKVYML